MTEAVRVDIVSDVVCPWCYIGWSRLKQAAGELDGEVQLDVHWLPFELNPDMPAEGMNRRAYLEQKFGKERMEESFERISAAASADGVPMRLDRIERSPSTLKAHRLLLLAEEAGNSTELNERLFEDYFVQGRDIGDHEVLVEAAAAVGLPADKAAEFLESDVGEEEVKALEGEAHRLGIQGVPFFILDRRLAVSGAQAPDIMVGAIKRALEMRAEGSPPPAG
jgi:predicted DsbA family dithiol-disulfide isomerase